MALRTDYRARSSMKRMANDDRRRGAMQIFARYRTYVNLAQRQSRTEIGATLKRRGGKRDSRTRGRRGEAVCSVRRLLHPLKIQPGILLGTDLNNAAGDERWPGEHALPPPLPLSSVPLPQPLAASWNPKLKSRTMQDPRKRPDGQARAKRVRTRFPGFHDSSPVGH